MGVMSRLASLVAETDIEFRLPFFDQTKGETFDELGWLESELALAREALG